MVDQNTELNNILNILNAPISLVGRGQTTAQKKQEEAISFLRSYSRKQVVAKLSTNIIKNKNRQEIYSKAERNTPKYYINKNVIYNARIYIEPEATCASFSTWEQNCQKHISLLDTFHDSQNKFIKELKNIYKQDYSQLIINFYKYQITKEILQEKLPNVEDEHIMYIICTLTSKSMVDTCIRSLDEKWRFQMALQCAPDWNYCKRLMDSLNYSFVIHNVNDNRITIYNASYMNVKRYIIFKFYSIKLLVLFQIKISDVPNPRPTTIL